MKSKPDVSGFIPKRDPTEFLEGGAADRAERPMPPTVAATVKVTVDASARPEPTVQKLFRLRWDVANALKTEVQQHVQDGKGRITETEIVENLLKDRYGLR